MHTNSVSGRDLFHLYSDFKVRRLINGRFMNIYALQSLIGSVQGQNRDFPVYFFQTGKNLFSLQGSQLMKTGYSL